MRFRGHFSRLLTYRSANEAAQNVQIEDSMAHGKSSQKIGSMVSYFVIFRMTMLTDNADRAHLRFVKNFAGLLFFFMEERAACCGR